MSDLHPILLGRYYRAYRAAKGLYVQPLAQQRQAEKNSLAFTVDKIAISRRAFKREVVRLIKLKLKELLK
ncbi:TPA: hypothetical protein ACSCXL_004138 [Aeromonas veronii]